MARKAGILTGLPLLTFRAHRRRKMENKHYIEKLKDPRWQKLRLKIFERDEFCCQRCSDGESTLVAHHLNYLPNTEPWDYPIENFITLCESCHEFDHSVRGDYEKQLLSILKSKGFMADDIYRIVYGFLKLQLPYPPEVTATIIEFALSKAFNEIINMFWDYTKRKTENNLGKQ